MLSGAESTITLIPMNAKKGKKHAATIRDVAAESGFSPATVSIVLNNAPLSRYIQATTKERIVKAARKLGYQPNQLARSLRSRRNNTIGVVVFDLTDPFCTPIMRGIENTLYQSSYVSLLADAHNELSRFEKYLEMLLERRVEGMIVIANWTLVDIALLADLEKRNIPTVVIGRELQNETINSIMVDNEAGGRIALQHLHSLQHRKIAFVRGPKSVVDSPLRWQGITDYAQSVGLPVDPKLVIELPDRKEPNSSFEGGYRAVEELIKRKRPFTAVLAFDDMTALGVMRGLAERGISVPDQCSVIGFDDVAPAAFSNPALTTVRQPMEGMGSTAVEIVVESLSSDLRPGEISVVHRKISPELVVRASTRAASLTKTAFPPSAD
ncbi:transcriptional regulator, LacI family [Candidatus Koribacter versatilis Ellin345]|uniref:Transcriptional regulator, LacI family n=2 Tax=Candidatus Korobacter versatilis TaxID=658062 RepID=Q1IR67_KORVE|nr:transcriptional regulator, LacI family [Candidatus Koribacter versatilis Ellin345]